MRPIDDALLASKASQYLNNSREQNAIKNDKKMPCINSKLKLVPTVKGGDYLLLTGIHQSIYLNY